MMMRKITLVLLAVMVLLAGCGIPQPSQVSDAIEVSTFTPTRPAPLQAYYTPTRTATATMAAPGLSTPIPITPAPTATPFTHTVAKGETMLGIAIRYGVTLEALKTANPTADPRMLSIGTQLVVPLMGTEVGPPPTETPVPLPIVMPACYPAEDGGLWCAAYLMNDQETDLENLSAWIGLYVGDEVWSSQTVVPPLNKVAAGEQAPLVAYFAGPIPAGAWPRVEALTSIPVAEEDSRYLQVETDQLQVELLADSRAAQVKAQVGWAEGLAVPGSVWVVAAAEDSQGRLVGVRKLETRPTCAQEANCRSMEVTLTVYSLGPEIKTVRLFVEARPALPLPTPAEQSPTPSP